MKKNDKQRLFEVMAIVNPDLKKINEGLFDSKNNKQASGYESKEFNDILNKHGFFMEKDPVRNKYDIHYKHKSGGTMIPLTVEVDDFSGNNELVTKSNVRNFDVSDFVGKKISLDKNFINSFFYKLKDNLDRQIQQMQNK